MSSAIKPGPMPNFREWLNRGKKEGKALSRRYKAMRTRSKAGQLADRIYRKLKAVFLREHPRCQFRGCTRRSTQVHHKAGRGKFYLIVRTWMAICRSHHTWIHNNVKAARERGYLLPEYFRLNSDDDT